MAQPDPLLPAPADPLGETLHMLRLTGTPVQIEYSSLALLLNFEHLAQLRRGTGGETQNLAES